MSFTPTFTTTTINGVVCVLEDDVRKHLEPNSYVDFKEWYAGNYLVIVGGRRYIKESLVTEYFASMNPLIREQPDNTEGGETTPVSTH